MDIAVRFSTRHVSVLLYDIAESRFHIIRHLFGISWKKKMYNSMILKIVPQVHVHLLFKLRRCDIFKPNCFNWYWGIFFKPWSFEQWKLKICFTGNCFNSKSLNTWSYPAMKNQAFSSTRSFQSKAPLSDITWWTYTFSSWNNIYKFYSPNKVSTETNFKEYW